MQQRPIRRGVPREAGTARTAARRDKWDMAMCSAIVETLGGVIGERREAALDARTNAHDARKRRILPNVQVAGR
jgi:hypothetical protein